MQECGNYLTIKFGGLTSLFNPTGKLLTMARDKVTTDGYLFKKGHSRSKHMSSESDEPPCKRKKIDAEERAREIKLLQDNLETLDSRLRVKQQLLDKARSLQNYKQCDEILGETIKVRKEKATIQNQLLELQKRENKSSWYHKKKQKKQHKETNVKQTEGNQKLPFLFRRMSSTSSESDTSIISTSESTTECESTSPRKESDDAGDCTAEEPAGISKQDFQETPPHQQTM